MITRFLHLSLLIITAIALSSCSEPAEAPRVQLPVQVDAAGVTEVQNNLGYTIKVTTARAAINDLVFTVAGEVHQASALDALLDLVVPSAHAHPGHYEGGEVTGELRGQFVVDWTNEDAKQLGVATLIAAQYSAANFTLARGDANTLGADDPLSGHTAFISGTATKDGKEISFTIIVDSPVGRQLVGVPFEATINSDTSGTLGLRLNLTDAIEDDTLFDDMDFAALDGDGDNIVKIAPDMEDTIDAYNLFRRVFQTHDHFSIQYKE